MNRELKLLNYFCVLVAVGFLVAVVLNLVTAGDLLTTDTLFFSTVCLLMAVIFAVGPILYLYSEGKLPVPWSAKKQSIKPRFPEPLPSQEVLPAQRPTSRHHFSMLKDERFPQMSDRWSRK